MAERVGTVALIEAAVADGASRCKACEHAGLSERTYRRWRDGDRIRADGRADAVRPAPRHKLTPEERATVLLTCQLPHFVDLPPSQIVPTMVDAGHYLASESTFYRVLRETGQQHERGRARRRSSAEPTTHVATGPNQVWCWDVTWLNSPVRGQFYYLYMIEDVWSRKIVAWEVYESETGELASELVSRAVLAERCSGAGLVLHADNGGPQKSSTLRATLDRLGLRRSFSRPRVSDDNAYIESLFRTVKYTPGFPVEGFATIEAARVWVLGFVRWYNETHKHSGIKFVTPGQRHDGRDVAVLAQRKRVYAEARRRTPSRWSGDTRDWSRPSQVWLNPEHPTAAIEEKSSAAA